MIIINTINEQIKLRENGRIVGVVHKELKKLIRPGITTLFLDKIAEEIIRSEGATPVFKGYKGYDFSTCISVNEEVVHGRPNAQRVLQDGDIVSVDVGTNKLGYCGDACFTIGVGVISRKAESLLKATKGALNAAISVVKEGVTTGMIGSIIEAYAANKGFSVIKEYGGHSIGRELHMDPFVPNYGRPIEGQKLKAGCCICIEPILCLGSPVNHRLKDGWTVVTDDKSLSAHEEHQIIVHKDYAEIITS